MLGSDFNVMRGMAVKNITEGVRDAGSNANGAMAGFMGSWHGNECPEPDAVWTRRDADTGRHAGKCRNAAGQRGTGRTDASGRRSAGRTDTGGRYPGGLDM